MTAIHNIAWGDTLSQIAQRYGTSVNALMDANAQIKDADLIYAGDALSIPGTTGSAGNASGPGASGVDGVKGGGPVSGNNAAAIAEQFIGRNAGELKFSDELPMQSWVPNNVNCANFVSACLQKAGLIDAGQASASVDQLANNLKGDGWQTVSLANASPGDVVLMQRNGQSHVVLFAGFENGQPKFIGSNNVNADGSQRISWGGASGNYEIITPPR
ncbi:MULTISPECIES: LysM domain-containing protein [unclassified Luteimonas]|uniref:LysM peptidoglycan-binding domain-containing protein n=1 Tax=unclassified Luteimonas TaxID=2629088 RepID=UPI0018F09CC9|nr:MULTISPECIES: LysM domain-containing protein [unclassified Luteimonas]MBJ6980129.1 LysM peptidoglycan-binding domain-containing protein [Luteimonas sp. MC1895]MBJ6985392.1 LysM peptidoglycan-binding domain-containing protein [Luteimonas sp. MC1750]QQO05349.1 LysM peptidoglycan-binding domain-containing protein [Luteimonas sp. MC1750]